MLYNWREITTGEKYSVGSGHASPSPAKALRSVIDGNREPRAPHLRFALDTTNELSALCASAHATQAPGFTTALALRKKQTAGDTEQIAAVRKGCHAPSAFGADVNASRPGIGASLSMRLAGLDVGCVAALAAPMAGH